MSKPKLIARARPGSGNVRVRSKIFPYSRITKMELNEEMVYIQLLRQIPRLVLRTVKEVVLKEKFKVINWEQEFKRRKKWITVNGVKTWRAK